MKCHHITRWSHIGVRHLLVNKLAIMSNEKITHQDLYDAHVAKMETRANDVISTLTDNLNNGYDVYSGKLSVEFLNSDGTDDRIVRDIVREHFEGCGWEVEFVRVPSDEGINRPTIILYAPGVRGRNENGIFHSVKSFWGGFGCKENTKL